MPRADRRRGPDLARARPPAAARTAERRRRRAAARRRRDGAGGHPLVPAASDALPLHPAAHRFRPRDRRDRGRRGVDGPARIRRDAVLADARRDRRRRGRERPPAREADGGREPLPVARRADPGGDVHRSGRHRRADLREPADRHGDRRAGRRVAGESRRMDGPDPPRRSRRRRRGVPADDRARRAVRVRVPGDRRRPGGRAGSTTRPSPWRPTAAVPTRSTAWSTRSPSARRPSRPCGRRSAPCGDAEHRYRTLVEQLPLAIYIDALDEARNVALQQPAERRHHRLHASGVGAGSRPLRQDHPRGRPPPRARRASRRPGSTARRS